MRSHHRSILVVATLLVAGMVSACGDDSASGSDPSAARLRKHADGVATRAQLPPIEGINAPGAGQPDEPGVSDDNVVNGAEAKIGQLPWTVALVHPGKTDNFCGGVLVAPTLVLTAAHCTQYQERDANGKKVGPKYLVGPDWIHVIAGRLRLSDGGGQEVKVAEVHQAAAYDSAKLTTDYAFLVLETPVTQKAISLPSSNASELWAQDAPIVVAGWGCQFANTKPLEPCEGAGGSPLEFTTLKVANGADCSDDAGAIDPATNLCMVSQSYDSATCQGDSGGPYIAQGRDGTWYVVALVSYGPVGCPPGEPEVGSFVKFLVDESGDLRPFDAVVCSKGELCNYPT